MQKIMLGFLSSANIMELSELEKWCEELGLNYHTVYIRIKRDQWTPKEALNLISRKK